MEEPPRRERTAQESRFPFKKMHFVALGIARSAVPGSIGRPSEQQPGSGGVFFK